MSRTSLVVGAALVAGGALAAGPLRRSAAALLLRTTGTVVRDERPAPRPAEAAACGH